MEGYLHLDVQGSILLLFIVVVYCCCYLVDVTGLSVSVGNNAGELDAEWDSVSSSSATAYRLSYTPMGSTLATITEVPLGSGGGRVSYTIERLTGNTRYSISVAVVCGEDGVGTFTNMEATTNQMGMYVSFNA